MDNVNETNAEGVSPLQLWYERATRDERQQAADGAKTSTSVLYQWARGIRKAGAVKGGMLCDEIGRINSHSPSLPPVVRADVVAACVNCPHALAAPHASDVSDLF